MLKVPAVISEKSNITVSFAVTLLALAFSIGIAWADLSDLKKKVDVLQNIDRRLSRIEGKLGVSQ